MRNAERAGVTYVLEGAGFEVREDAGNLTVRIKVPGSGVGHRTSERSYRGGGIELAPVVAAVDGIEAAGPG